MKGWIGVTDNEWFSFLSQQPGIDEVNFWQPGGKTLFKSLKAGEPFLFKLHAPYNYIVGGGFFAHSSILPISVAWEAFGKKNGAESLEEMRARTEKYRRTKPQKMEDYNIGCILLQLPFFFEERDWIAVPDDFSLHIQQGKRYDLRVGHGRHLWEQVELRLTARIHPYTRIRHVAEPQQRYGEPTLTLPRLGQGSFRVLVTDTYQRRCAITQERVLPALDAAHIKPFGLGGEHRIDNGILLRSDIHRLFDTGYVTVSPDYDFAVSRRIKEDFDNGRYYYTFHGQKIYVPHKNNLRPHSEFLGWHNENVFKG